MVERREFRRHRVGGNVEITSVLGAGSVPQERAAIVDCSLGGARLRVPSPRRRLFKALPPCLAPRDSLTCVLRLAPDYDAIEVFAEVVRAERLPDDADVLDVGLRFFHDGRRSHAQKPMARLARIIEPDGSVQQEALAAAAAGAEAARTSRRLPASTAPTPPERPAAQSARQHGQRLGRVVEAAAPPASASQKAERTSARLPQAERATSARQAPAEPSAREERASRRAARVSARHERRTSARLDRPERTSSRVTAPREDEAAEARVSGRLAGARLDPERVTPPRAPSSDSEVVAWASSRLTAPAPAPERVATADDEVTVRGSARLIEGKAVIELPGAFTALAREAGLTAHVTPTADCAGLFVAERSPARLVVRELGGGKSAASFDYLVVATRRA